MHVIPMIITCMLQGTLCDTGIPRTFYGGNICSVHTSGHMYIYVLEAMRPFVLVIHFSSTYTGHSMYYMHVVAVSSDCIRGPRRYACSIAIHHCPTKVLHMPFVFTPAAYPQ